MMDAELSYFYISEHHSLRLSAKASAPPSADFHRAESYHTQIRETKVPQVDFATMLYMRQKHGAD